MLEALRAVPDAELTVVDTLADLLGALKGAEALVLYDAPPDQARQVVDALSAPGNTVRWMHFLTAGREGFDAVGLPREFAVTTPAGCVAPTVAEHAMTLLLALMRRVPAMLEEQAKRNWSRLDVSAQGDARSKARRWRSSATARSAARSPGAPRLSASARSRSRARASRTHWLDRKFYAARAGPGAGARRHRDADHRADAGNPSHVRRGKVRDLQARHGADQRRARRTGRSDRAGRGA